MPFSFRKEHGLKHWRVLDCSGLRKVESIFQQRGNTQRNQQADGFLCRGVKCGGWRPCVQQGVGDSSSLRSLLTLTILWSCESALFCSLPTTTKLLVSTLTSKVALGQGFKGRLDPILLTTLRAEPWGLFCQMGIVWKKPYCTINIQSQLSSLRPIKLGAVIRYLISDFRFAWR